MLFVPILQGYNPSTGNSQGDCPTGTLLVSQAIQFNATSGVRIQGAVDKLSTIVGSLCDSSNQCGIHIHDGFSCDDASLVGGHYMQATPDPWSGTKYFTDSNGLVQLDVTSGPLDIKYVAGRTIVIHDRNNRIGCGGESKDM